MTTLCMERPPSIATIPTLLVDDHAIWRDGMRSLLEQTEFRVVGDAASGHEAIAVARRVRPTLTLLDIRMHDGDGFEALVALKALDPKMAVLMLSSYDNPTYMARAVAGGASGYLLKGATRDEILDAMRAVTHGELLLSAHELARALRGISENAALSDDLFQPLTDREIEVLRLVATGLCNRDIGKILFIAEGTVKTHLEHIIGKLGVSDRVQAAVWAARQGLASPESGRV